MNKSNIDKRLAGLHYEAGKLPKVLLNSTSFWSLSEQYRRLILFSCSPTQLYRIYNLKHTEKKKLNSYDCKKFLDTSTLFIHIPKAAGISVVQGLYGRKTGDHRTMKDYSLIFSPKELKSLYKFTFVRNPWDRVYSAYKFLSEDGRNDFDKMWFEREASKYENFNSFIKYWLNEENIARSLHFKLQSDFLSPYGDKLDFVGKYENLDEDYNLLRNKIGFGDTLPALNTTKKRQSNFKDAYNKESIEIIRRVYATDIARFKYGFN